MKNALKIRFLDRRNKNFAKVLYLPIHDSSGKKCDNLNIETLKKEDNVVWL